MTNNGIAGTAVGSKLLLAHSILGMLDHHEKNKEERATGSGIIELIQASQLSKVLYDMREAASSAAARAEVVFSRLGQGESRALGELRKATGGDHEQFFSPALHEPTSSIREEACPGCSSHIPEY